MGLFLRGEFCIMVEERTKNLGSLLAKHRFYFLPLFGFKERKQGR